MGHDNLPLMDFGKLGDYMGQWGSWLPLTLSLLSSSHSITPPLMQGLGVLCVTNL